jgi:hypothetical protein
MEWVLGIDYNFKWIKDCLVVKVPVNNEVASTSL